MTFRKTEWFMWIADIVGRIEDDRMMLAIKYEGTADNPYRESVVDHACLVAFGDKNPTQEMVFYNHGPMVARMLARGTQGRADTTRSLRNQGRELVEDVGPKFMTEAHMSRLRAASAKGARR